MIKGKVVGVMIISFFVVITAMIINSEAIAILVHEMKVNKRLLAAHKHLEQEAQKSPDDKNEAVITFDSFKTENELLIFNKRYPNIQVSSIFYVTVGLNNNVISAGSYGLDGKAKITAALLKKARAEVVRDSVLFGITKPREILQGNVLQKKKMVISEKTPNLGTKTKEKVTKIDFDFYEVEDRSYNSLMKSTESIINDNKQSVKHLKDNGLKITGVSIIATNKTLFKLATKVFVKSVEVKNAADSITRMPILSR